MSKKGSIALWEPHSTDGCIAQVLYKDNQMSGALQYFHREVETYIMKTTNNALILIHVYELHLFTQKEKVTKWGFWFLEF